MILPDAIERFGPLTEAVQVKGAIALADISRRGMAIDLEHARGVESRLDSPLLSLRRVRAAALSSPACNFRMVVNIWEL